jgi:hypothetical protein
MVGKLMWMTRDKAGAQHYNLYFKKKAAMHGDGFWRDMWTDYDYTMCPIEFHKILPKESRLKPGDGPVRVRVTIERVEAE